MDFLRLVFIIIAFLIGTSACSSPSPVNGPIATPVDNVLRQGIIKGNIPLTTSLKVDGTYWLDKSVEMNTLELFVDGQKVDQGDEPTVIGINPLLSFPQTYTTSNSTLCNIDIKISDFGSGPNRVEATFSQCSRYPGIDTMNLPKNTTVSINGIKDITNTIQVNSQTIIFLSVGGKNYTHMGTDDWKIPLLKAYPTVVVFQDGKVLDSRNIEFTFFSLYRYGDLQNSTFHIETE